MDGRDTEKGAETDVRSARSTPPLTDNNGAGGGECCTLSWNFETIHGARNRVGIGLSYRPARLHSWSIPGLNKRLKIRALYCTVVEFLNNYCAIGSSLT